MGGHGDFHALKSDPSIARWSSMRENVFKTFVFNRRTSRIALVWGAIVPVSLYLFMSRGVDVDLAGKTRAESLRKSAPQVAQQD